MTCPTLRIHPAIVAQAAATTAAMLPGRFFLGVGTGENLNEHVLGQRWPSTRLRREMLEEAVEVMRVLWSGDLTSHRGRHYTVENARIYTLPDEPSTSMVAAGGQEAAELAARIGDGLIGTAPDEASSWRRSTRRAARASRATAQVTVCWAETRERGTPDRARVLAERRRSRGQLGQELPLPRHFEAAAAMVTRGRRRRGDRLRPRSGALRKGDRRVRRRGLHHVYVHQVGADQEGFFRFYESQLQPRYATLASSAR